MKPEVGSSSGFVRALKFSQFAARRQIALRSSIALDPPSTMATATPSPTPTTPTTPTMADDADERKLEQRRAAAAMTAATVLLVESAVACRRETDDAHRHFCRRRRRRRCCRRCRRCRARSLQFAGGSLKLSAAFSTTLVGRFWLAAASSQAANFFARAYAIEEIFSMTLSANFRLSTCRKPPSLLSDESSNASEAGRLRGSSRLAEAQRRSKAFRRHAEQIAKRRRRSRAFRCVWPH